jgi:uncharacterized phage protein (TIGR01671 family)
MREIKFRTCHNVTKVIEYITLQELADGDRFEFDYETYDWMQYTGLQDKNDKEIYEGDILCIEDYYHDLQDGIAISKIPENRIEAVEWAEAGMWQTDNDVLSEVCSISEVIGNIYENPDLLETK